MARWKRGVFLEGGGGVEEGEGLVPQYTPYAFIQNLQQLLMQAFRVFFPIILFETNMAEKDKFLFLYISFTPLMTPICKRKNK